MSPLLRRRLAAAASSLTILASLVVAVPAASAASVIGVTTTNQEINGDGFCSLQEAIYAANLDDSVAPDPTSPGDFVATACVGGDGADIIELPPMSVFTFADPISDADNYVGPSVTPIITSEIIIEGRGARLERHSLGRLTRAFVIGFGGDLDLREVHVKGFGIHGGNGADGGGGGMGAGGAIYVDLGDLRIQWSTFEGNTAEGGDGAFRDTSGAGGGGGLAGDGGPSGSFGGGGGGGGARGSGGSGTYDTGGGGGGRVTSGQTPEPGEPCGGRGGEDPNLTGADDGDAASCVGGGGGGGTDRVTPFDPISGGAGGDGTYGGGGGGGGDSGDGGDGGFGAGGGGGTGLGMNGGDSQFGGGGGSGAADFAGVGGRGQGGTFGGDGARNSGGGGAGLGGAVFGYLADITISNSTFAFNGAYRGRNGGDATDGRGAGGAVFTAGGDLAIESSTFAGNETVTVTDGGGGAIVVYDPEGNEEATLLLRNTIVAGNGTSECYTRNGVDTGGSASNIITDSTLNNLGNPACPGVSSSDDPQLGSLLLNPPGRTPTMAIGPGSSAVDTAVYDPTTSPADDQRGVPRPQGAGPDIGAFEFSGQGPVTTITLSPASPDGSNGWYINPVGVTISASDADSVVAQTRCALDPAAVPGSFSDLPDEACSLSNVSTDGSHAIYAASVDTEGNTETSVASASLQIDQTDPTLSPTLSSTVITVGQAGVTASPNASDDTSGVASSGCDPVDTSTPGVHTLTCTATDNAGNTSSTTVPYLVEYAILGFFEPVPGSMWRAGQTVPIKIALGDAGGTRISDADALALAASCSVTFSVEGVQSKRPQCMKYDSVNDQFVYPWKLGKRPLGAVTIVVTVSYPDTSSTTQLAEEVTITK